MTQLRSSSVTGVFVVLNTCDLDARKTNGRLPGIYLRDLDPDAAASERNEDLMLSFCTGRNREVHAYFDGLLLAARAGL